MSLAKFTGGSWNDMDSRHNAPRIYAAVVRRPDDFRIVPPYTLNDDLELAVIPQVCWVVSSLQHSCVGVGAIRGLLQSGINRMQQARLVQTWRF